MTLLIAFLSLSAVIFGWLWAIERGLRLAAEADYLRLQAAHNVAIDDLDDMLEAMLNNAKTKHPASHLTLIRGEGA